MPLFAGYDVGPFFDEMFQSPDSARSHYARLRQLLGTISADDFNARCRLAEETLIHQGITFTVYGNEMGIEKPFPVDLVPRVIPDTEWRHIELGLKQRVRALNAFIDDVYHDQRILRENIIPRELVVNAPSFRRDFAGVRPPLGVYTHICGTDLIRDAEGTYTVLEDNCRTPSGISYVLENRLLQMRLFPQLFREHSVRPVDHYTTALLQNLKDLAPNVQDPVIVVLTPGVYNSAYFEHTFLAQQLGVELVEGRDLVVDNNHVFMKTTSGMQKVDVIYRRVDDDFLDPLVFRPDSMLGVPGLVHAYRAGNVALANAIGTGVADDKVIYTFVPKMIKFYLSEEPILPNVETYLAWQPEHLSHILANMHQLVVKCANESGGYGMIVGPQATDVERAEFAEKVKANPREYIAQPLIALSRCPCWFGSNFEGRHVDLRPYILMGKDVTIVPGGLTRVALRKGSYVVNSSQGGGSKDTWVLAPETGGAVC